MRTISKTIIRAVLCIALSAVAAGCTKTPAGKASLKFSLSQNEIPVGEKVQFQIISEAVPDEDILIRVKSDNPKIATVPATVTLKAGEKSVSGEVEALTEGLAVISVSADNATITDASERLTVKSANGVDLSLTLSAEELYAGERGEIVVSTPVASETDITVNVESSDPLIASVPATVVLKAGEKTVKGEMVAASAGTASITIKSEGTKISSYMKSIKVKTPLRTELTLSAVSQTVFVGKRMKITISTPAAPTSDINISLISGAPEILVPVTADIVLSAGQKEVTAEIEGLSQGVATLSFVANPVVNVIKDIIEFDCQTKIPEIYEISSSSVVGPGNKWDNFKHELSPYNTGGLWYDYTTVWDGQYGADIYKTMLEPYGGDFVGGYYKNMGVVKSVEYDTRIDDKLNWIKNIRGSYPSFWTEDGYSIGRGEFYIVCTLPSIAMDDPDNEFYRAWLKINSNGSYVQVLEGAICINDAVFRVGMKPVE